LNNETVLSLSARSADENTDSGPSIRAPTALDDELVFEAKQRITLRCGKSSITLYPNGKIALRGEYILSDSEGINRIAGGQIELN
jgi:uncharacterized protein (DUF2345 family)